MLQNMSERPPSWLCFVSDCHCDTAKYFPLCLSIAGLYLALCSFPFSSSMHVQATRARGVMSMAQSKALPFLKAPAKLDGSLAGDYGFDPMGISDQVRKNGE